MPKEKLHGLRGLVSNSLAMSPGPGSRTRTTCACFTGKIQDRWKCQFIAKHNGKCTPLCHKQYTYLPSGGCKNLLKLHPSSSNTYLKFYRTHLKFYNTYFKFLQRALKFYNTHLNVWQHVHKYSTANNYRCCRETHSKLSTPSAGTSLYLLCWGGRQVGGTEPVQVWHDDHSALSQVHRCALILRYGQVWQETLCGGHHEHLPRATCVQGLHRVEGCRSMQKVKQEWQWR